MKDSTVNPSRTVEHKLLTDIIGITSEQKVFIRNVGYRDFTNVTPLGLENSLDLIERGWFPEKFPNKRMLEAKTGSCHGITIEADKLGGRGLKLTQHWTFNKREVLGGQFFTAAAISAQEGGEGVGGSLLTMARGGRRMDEDKRESTQENMADVEDEDRQS